MSSSSSSTISTGMIIVGIVSSVFGVAACIGCCVVIACLIKRFNAPRGAVGNGMPFQPYPDPNYPPPYSNYPPQYPNNAPYYPPPNPAGPSAADRQYPNVKSEFTKMPNP
jgi:hypothetical protein